MRNLAEKENSQHGGDHLADGQENDQNLRRKLAQRREEKNVGQGDADHTAQHKQQRILPLGYAAAPAGEPDGKKNRAQAAFAESHQQRRHFLRYPLEKNRPYRPAQGGTEPGQNSDRLVAHGTLSNSGALQKRVFGRRAAVLLTRLVPDPGRWAPVLALVRRVPDRSGRDQEAPGPKDQGQDQVEGRELAERKARELALLEEAEEARLRTLAASQA